MENLVLRGTINPHDLGQELGVDDTTITGPDAAVQTVISEALQAMRNVGKDPNLSARLVTI